MSIAIETLVANLAALPSGTLLVGAAVKQFTTSLTSAQLLTAMANETYDVIELAGGTYHLANTVINIDRKRPLIVRPAQGATVILNGSLAQPAGQFVFGLNGVAGNITMSDFTFDSWAFDQTGLCWIGNAHHITLNNMTVTNSIGTVSAVTAYGLYVSHDGGAAGTDIVANGWTVTGGGSRAMSAAQVQGVDALHERVQLHNWTVTNCAYAYVSTPALLTGLDMNHWTITNCGTAGFSCLWQGPTSDPGAAIVMGIYRNFTLTSSDPILADVPSGMVDGGGNPGSKFYLHAAASADTGSLPGAGGLQSDGDKSGSDANVNKDMNVDKSNAQASTSIVSLGTVSGQNLRLARFLSRPISSNQTIPAQDIRLHIGAKQSGAGANVRPAFQLFVWRPSNGTKVGNLVLGPKDANAITGTTEVNAITGSATSSALAVLSGDIFVLELWVNAAQADTATYTDTLYFDGAFEDSIASNAAFLYFPVRVV